MTKDYDVIIIGAGIVGSMVARFLAKYKLDILLIEKEVDVGMGTSSANSAAVHAGYNALPGTNKAITNAMAIDMWPVLAQELGIPYNRCGDYVVAISTEDMKMLEILMERGRINGVPGMEIIDGNEMRRMEPLVHPDTKGVLWAPTGGISDPFAATIAAAENAVMNGIDLRLNTAFENFIIENNRITGIHTNQGDYHSRWVVNAAGLYADEVMHKAGIRPEFKIHPPPW